jgi:hypothetical protein
LAHELDPLGFIATVLVVGHAAAFDFDGDGDIVGGGD